MRHALVQDLRYALRMLARSPLFSLVAILSLALGIGANAAILGVVNAVLKPRVGIAAPSELVDIGRSQNGSGFDNMSYPNYVDLRDRNDVLSGVAAYRLSPQPMGFMSGGSEAERIYSMTVSGNYFEVLGVAPAAGRFFSREEDAAAGERRAVVLSERFWARRFSRDTSIVGRTLILNGQDFAVVGVAAAGFRGTSILAPDVWVPIHAAMSASMLANRRAVWMVAIGRLKPGVEVGNARAALQGLGTSLERTYPEENRGKSFAVTPSRMIPGDVAVMVFAFLGLLMAIAGLVLLIACVNLTGMLLARATARRREIGVRLALGASRRRVIGQLVVETLTLFAAGGMLGLAVGRWLIALLLAFIPQLPVPVLLDVSLDARVIVVTALVALVAGSMSGLVPALQATRTDLLSALKQDPGTGVRLRRARLRSVLVVSQVAMSLLLMIAAALFVRSLQQAASIDPGFDPSNVELVSLDLRLATYEREAGLQLTRRLLDRASAIPGVRSASFALSLPLGGGGFSLGAVTIPGVDGGGGVDADWNVISPAYFETMRIPLVQGRGFDARDRRGAPAVAIVNETMARRFWPSGGAVGRHMTLNGEQDLEVVGVARDSKYRSLGEAARHFIYVPLEQQYNERLTLLVRGDGARSVIPAVREALRDLDPKLPIVTAQTLDEFISLGLVPQRVLVAVAGGLGLVGLLLAALGVYGITAYAVTWRTREIGIRMALGADRSNVLRLVMWQGMALGIVGLGIGLVAALGVTRLLAGLLYGITPSDPISYAATAVMFVAITLLASYLPARRAAALDPTLALRHE